MKTITVLPRTFILLMALFALMASSFVTAAPITLTTVLPLTVQTKANASNAVVGDFDANIGASALISVLVTDATGNPKSNLGASVGNGTAAISLPTGWSLSTQFNVVPGACLMSPTQFANVGTGIYTIRVVPLLSAPSCTWLSGDYHYVVKVENKPNSSLILR
ncbi:MAG: hypothetical protein PHU14_16810, partial [Methylovulum sp.]|nr:hypothetical protein [Methylovulum sp.]